MEEREKPITVLLAGTDLALLEDLVAREGTSASHVLRCGLRVYGALPNVPGRRPTAPAPAAQPGAAA